MCHLSFSQVFHGNQNPTDEVRARLPKPTLTRYLRIRPLTWEQGICMRFEVYGCKISGILSHTHIHSRDFFFVVSFSHNVTMKSQQWFTALSHI